MLSEMILGSVAMTHQVGNMKIHLLGKGKVIHIPVTSVSDLDPVGSVYYWLSWIRIRIQQLTN